MSINRKWSRLNRISDCPDANGIYGFGHTRPGGVVETVYLGRAQGSGGLRARVFAHANGTQNGNPGLSELIARCPNFVRVRWLQAGWFDSPTNMEVDALRRFVDAHGRLPRFNSRQELVREGLVGLLDEIFGA